MKCSPTSIKSEICFLSGLFLASVSASGMWAGRVGLSPRIARGVSLTHAEISFMLLPAGMVCIPPCVQTSGHPEIALLHVAFFIAVREIRALHEEQHSITPVWTCDTIRKVFVCQAVSALHGGKDTSSLAGVILLCSPVLCRNKKSLHFHYRALMKHEKSTNQPTRWKLHVHSVYKANNADVFLFALRCMISCTLMQVIYSKGDWRAVSSSLPPCPSNFA